MHDRNLAHLVITDAVEGEGQWHLRLLLYVLLFPISMSKSGRTELILTVFTLNLVASAVASGVMGYRWFLTSATLPGAVFGLSMFTFFVNAVFYLHVLSSIKIR